MIFLGVKIDGLNLPQSVQKARNFLNSPGQYKIFTPNPEMMVKAQKDEYFKKILNEGDLNLCDGFGLSLFSGAPRIAGVDFMLELCALAQGQGRSTYLLGSGSDEVIKKTAEELTKKFPQLKIAGYNKGPIIDERYLDCHSERSEESLSGYQLGQRSFANAQDDNTLQIINNSRANILFVAFGMGKQEKWIAENLPKMPSVKIAMGVGGAFDFISGVVPRAPGFMRQFGLEWMYRLVKQPNRLPRIFNATVRFIYYLITRNQKNIKIL